MIWKIWKKGKFNSERIGKIWKKTKLNSEKMWKIQKKSKLIDEVIWKIWKNGWLKCEKNMKNKEEVKRYGKYRRKAS